MQNFTLSWIGILLSKETDQEIFEIHFDCHNHKQELHRRNQLQSWLQGPIQRATFFESLSQLPVENTYLLDSAHNLYSVFSIIRNNIYMSNKNTK